MLRLTLMLPRWSKLLIEDGGELGDMNSSDDKKKVTKKFTQCGPSLDAWLILGVIQDLVHLPDQCFELEEVTINDAITKSIEAIRGGVEERESFREIEMAARKREGTTLLPVLL
jgi:hypothetical protein